MLGEGGWSQSSGLGPRLYRNDPQEGLLPLKLPLQV